MHLLKPNVQHAQVHPLEQFVRSNIRDWFGGACPQDQVARGMVRTCQELLSAQARGTVNDGKASKADPDAEFEFRADIKVVLLEALGARRLTHENHSQIVEQIFSPTGFKPSMGQDYLFELRTQTTVFNQSQGQEVVEELFVIFQCVQELDDLQKLKGVEKTTNKHISDEEVAQALQGQHWEKVKALRNRAEDGSQRFICTNWRKILKRSCSLKEAFHVAESMRISGGIPDLTFEVKGILANLLKGDNPEFWTNPFRDRIGKGCREDYQVPPEEPMDAKQKGSKSSRFMMEKACKVKTLRLTNEETKYVTSLKQLQMELQWL